MPESFSQRLRRKADDIWEAQHRHPFVRGIGDGTLDLEAFKFWVRQDYLFLIEYARVLGLAAAKAPDLETMTRFAGLLDETLSVEMSLHRSYAAEFAISEKELEREEMSPATRAYTDFLVRTAAVGEFAELVAALTPCMWGFSEIGQRLAARSQPADARYRRWIEMYSSPEFAELAAWCRDLLDRLAAGLRPDEQQRLESAFFTSSRYEYLSWEAAYRREDIVPQRSSRRLGMSMFEIRISTYWAMHFGRLCLDILTMMVYKDRTVSIRAVLWLAQRIFS